VINRLKKNCTGLHIIYRLIVPLRNCDGIQVSRDIVQFVPFNRLVADMDVVN
jgi:hypothetical protein